MMQRSTFLKLVVAAAIASPTAVGMAKLAERKDAGAMEFESYGDAIASLPPAITRVLAQHYQPDAQGALGRNQAGYFHVRFQMGLHHLAHHGIATQSTTALAQFISALDYAFRHQASDGGFQLTIPNELSSQGQPSATDLVSGTAFFLSSAGSGLLALKTSRWIQHTAALKPRRHQLDAIVQKLSPTLAYLWRQRRLLETADRQAPNRLLINATALMPLGQLLHNEAACQEARRLVAIALNQVHPDGYFIEGGGYDSSYNGVAIATLLRLALMDHSVQYPRIAARALDWQLSRISQTGEILTTGNARVHRHGETFLGRPKDVDVAHTLEALALASVTAPGEDYMAIAQRIYGYYQQTP